MAFRVNPMPNNTDALNIWVTRAIQEVAVGMLIRI